MPPKSEIEVAFADFSSTFTVLPVLEALSVELALPDPQAAMEHASTAASEPAAILRKAFIVFVSLVVLLFLESTTWKRNGVT